MFDYMKKQLGIGKTLRKQLAIDPRPAACSRLPLFLRCVTSEKSADHVHAFRVVLN